jgi:DhnA family fructose-bisphosphate aldolase class Ia
VLPAQRGLQEGRQVDYHSAADLTGQANHLGVTIQADIIKQKLPTNNGGFNALHFGKTHKRVYGELVTDHPVDLCRWQVANCYMGRDGTDQLRRRVQGRRRPRGGVTHRGAQQARPAAAA